MPTKQIGLLVLAVLTVTVAKAQDPVKLNHRNNPAYSVHNYKQPDKAAYAKKFNLDDTQSFVYVESNQKSVANYKQQAQVAPVAQDGAVVPAVEPVKVRQSIDSPANYKRQNR